jgi:hypothetical protein
MASLDSARSLALGLPEASEQAQHGFPSVVLFGLADFRSQQVDCLTVPREPQRLQRAGRNCGIPTLADDA